MAWKPFLPHRIPHLCALCVLRIFYLATATVEKNGSQLCDIEETLEMFLKFKIAGMERAVLLKE